MVRTRGGRRSRPKGKTSTSARDGAGTSRATTGHSPAQDTEAPPALTHDAAMMHSPASAAILEESPGAEPPSRRYHTRVGPRPPFLCIHDHPGGPRLPSGPGHLTRGSLHVLGPSLCLLQQPRIVHRHRLSYP